MYEGAPSMPEFLEGPSNPCLIEPPSSMQAVPYGYSFLK